MNNKLTFTSGTTPVTTINVDYSEILNPIQTGGTTHLPVIDMYV